MSVAPLRIIERYPFVRQVEMRDENQEDESARSGFLGALDEPEDLTTTEGVDGYVGCREEVEREGLFELKEGEEVVSKPVGSENLIWAKKPK